MQLVDKLWVDAQFSSSKRCKFLSGKPSIIVIQDVANMQFFLLQIMPLVGSLINGLKIYRSILSDNRLKTKDHPILLDQPYRVPVSIILGTLNFACT